MKAAVQILIMCIREKHFSDIYKEMKWDSGAVGVVLRHLMKSGDLQRIKRGTYMITEKGAKRIESETKMDKADDMGRRIHEASFITYLKLKRPTRPVDNIFNDKTYAAINYELGTIYFNSLKNGYEDTELTRATWEAHESMICIDHNFNFKKAFQKYAHTIKPLGEKEIFSTLHYNSLSDKTMIKIHLKNFRSENNIKQTTK